MQLPIEGIGIEDDNASVGNMQATFTATHGTVTINPCEQDGITASEISNNGQSTVTVVASLDALNTTLSADDGLIYRSNNGYGGWATLTIAVVDQGNTSITGGAEVAIAVDNAPVANPDTGYTVASGQLLTVPCSKSSGVLANDTGDCLQAELVSQASHGVVKLNPNGSFTYKADAWLHWAGQLQLPSV